VNAHTHLEYTDFASLGQQRFDHFEEWSAAFDQCYAVYRRTTSWADSARRGFAMCLKAGITRVADVVSSDSALDAWLRGEFYGRPYVEALGDDASSWNGQERTLLEKRLDDLQAHTDVGISPHAPYTVGTAALRDMFDVAAQRGMRVHPHLAEAPTENTLTRTGTGKLAQMVRELEIDLELLRTGGCGRTATSYIDDLGGLNRMTHVAHGVFLDGADRALLRNRGTFVALCPRSNSVVGSGAPPIAALLAEGNPIAVGTDSLASSPSLDLLDDVAALRDLARAQGYRACNLERRLLEAATVGGARAMGLDEKQPAGVFHEGARADFAVFDVDVPQSQDPYRVLIDGAPGHCSATAVDGVLAYDNVS
jgi:cytosine/adenosine deaminase-related metal-dependent hydrolase